MGYHLAQRLTRENNDVIVVEKDEQKAKAISESLDVQLVRGSGSSPSVLKKAGIEQAEMLIAVTDKDEVNIIACLIAAAQSSIPVKIARIREPEFAAGLPFFGEGKLKIDLIINPERESTLHTLKLLEVPGTTDIMDFAGGKIRLLGFAITEKSPACGKKIVDLNREDTEEKLLIAAIARQNTILIPRGNDIIAPGDILYTVTLPDKIDSAYRALTGGEMQAVHRVIICGGSNIGLQLAKALERKGISTKIIEPNKERSEQLAQELDKTLVLHGEGTDQDLLREENIRETDAFIAVSSDEEANVLASLLAKRLGAKRVMALLNKTPYFRLVTTIGVDAIISPRMAAVSSILQFIRKGKILSVTTVREDEAEAIEAVALDTSEIVDKPLEKVKFPKGAIVGAVVGNGGTIIPGGKTVIKSGDRVIIFATKSAVKKVEKLLTVKLEYF